MSLDDISTVPDLPALAEPVIVDDNGAVSLPSPFQCQSLMRVTVGNGIAVDWAPLGGGSALVAIWTKTAAIAGASIAAALARADLQQLILDLMSIDKQLGDM